MPACAIRYRLDGAGPAAYLVECEGRFHLYARGAVGAVVPPERLRGLLATPGPRWVPATGVLALDQPLPDAPSDPEPGRAAPPPTMATYPTFDAAGTP